MEPIAAEKLKEMIAKNPNLIVLDVRPAKDFIQGHIPRSLHVPLDGKLAIWATYVIDNNESFVVVCNPGDEADVATRLSRTGLDKAQGFLEGGFEAWKSAGYPTDKVRTLQAETGDEFAQKTSNGVVLDIRDPGELEGGIYEKAITKNFAQLKDSLKDKNDKEVFIHCAGGVRSLIGYSLMKRQGYNVTNIDGGFNRLAKIGVKTKKWAGKPACCLI
jgi:hydroxyacylglutathione hydrolase